MKLTSTKMASLWLALGLLLFSNSLFAEPLDAGKLKSALEKAVTNSGFKKSELGLWVGRRNESNVETIFGVNENTLMVPASLSKLVTMGAILNAMHPTYKYKTQLVATAAIKSGALNGDLFLKGGGDPAFVSENMWVLVNNLTRTGLNSVEGDIIVDDSRFDGVRFSEERETTRVDRAYDAPVGAMSMNWNSVNVYVRPGPAAGTPCEITADPVNTYIKIKNNCRTSASGQTVAVERTREKGFWGDVIEVDGKIGIGQDEIAKYKSITQPDLWAGANLIEFLKQRGITVKGKIKAGVAPKNATVLAFVESQALSEILADMAKFSNNYVAEMLVKNLAAEEGKEHATMQQGLAIVQKWLERMGFGKQDLIYTNASGFTRNNKFKPAQLGRFLSLMQTDFTMFPEYVMALPIAGVDGTLKKRMIGTAAERWVRAKTGLLDGVVGLSGYAGGSNGQTLNFVFIFNGPASREADARAFFDRMAAQLVKVQD